MVFAILLLLWAAVFPVQLYLCLCGTRWIKIFPIAVILIYMLCCTAAAMPELRLVSEDGRLAALIALFLGFFALVADGLTWLIYPIVKAAQNIKK